MKSWLCYEELAMKSWQKRGENAKTKGVGATKECSSKVEINREKIPQDWEQMKRRVNEERDVLPTNCPCLFLTID